MLDAKPNRKDSPSNILLDTVSRDETGSQAAAKLIAESLSSECNMVRDSADVLRLAQRQRYEVHAEEVTGSNFKLRDGYEVDPARVESGVRSADERKLIGPMIVVGAGERNVGAIVFLNEQACRDYCRENKIKVRAPQSYRDMADNIHLHQSIVSVLEAANKALPYAEQVEAIQIMRLDPSTSRMQKDGVLDRQRVLTDQAETREAVFDSIFAHPDLPETISVRKFKQRS